MSQDRFERFVGLVFSLNREIARIKDSEAERLGFRGGDVMCLYFLIGRPDGATSAELARLADVSRPAMSRTVTRLEEAGLVEVVVAEGSSRYRAPVRLTERGREASEPMGAIVRHILELTGSSVDAGRRECMYEALETILECLRSVDR